ncbi:MAG TPA: hypothetical protein VHE81_22910, partial [Lacipirellulaceae bacterium]|nr:hypothetical protein [Lacipirellulaceae bacterium]
MSGKISKIDTINIPPNWRGQLERQLVPDEALLASFEPDLDAKLHFAGSVVALTQQRILFLNSCRQGESNGAETTSQGNWRSWALNQVTDLRIREFGGMGALELLGPTALEATWQYTMARSTAAHQFVQAVKNSLSVDGPMRAHDQSLASAATICPSCGAKIQPPQTVCESCTPTAAPPPVRSLWRLGRFARPRALTIAIGVTLTLASIAFGLVPPYLTIPLVNILRDTGHPAKFSVVPWYLVAMFGAGVISWMLGWAKTYILARVSEQVSADLRNATYAHLQR